MSNVAKHPKTTEHFCNTYLKTASTSMKWSISEFDLLRIDSSHSLESLSFESVNEDVRTGTWKMKLVPKLGKKDFIGLFFNFSGNMANTFAEFEACLIDEEGEETNKMELASELVRNDLGFEDFIQKSNLVDFLLPDGLLTIRCDITVIRMSSTVSKARRLEPGNSLSKDFSLLMKDDTLSDAVLVCGDRKFPIHKCILSARSTVFSNQFKSECLENEKCIEIKDMGADVLENVLSYIYTDEILENCTADRAIELLGAADAYKLQELKGIAEKYLMEHVSNQNLLEVATAAELHRLTSLKEVCISFMRDNGKEIFLSGNSKDLFSSAPQYLVKGVFEKLFGARSPKKEPSNACVPESKPFVSKRVTSCSSCDPAFELVSTTGFQLPLLSQPSSFNFGAQPTAQTQTFSFGQATKK